ncbi:MULTISPECIES: hypothetical protein [Nocardiopsis]|uniref:Uncharacterized protein n=1 Tax=Nocardiopsis sinuspersici TaxID=501010 RepID=A0A1V3BVC8_9ACTN|nr:MULTISPECIES: hypothetical protein [Nocardiopsis]OOC52604.1 hypothetical protein NOSIN_01140 [Nocardiopsis sinuspersici]
MDSETWAAVAAVGAVAAAAIALVALFFTGRAANAAKKQTKHQKDAVKAAEAQTRLQEKAVKAAIAQTELQREAAETAAAQTELQRKAAQDAVQPYVWVDVVPDEAQGTILNLVLGNSGPTFAHNVRVTIEPPLPQGKLHGATSGQKRLSEGITALGPGRKLVWSLGVGHEVVQEDEPKIHTITIDADGPFGPLPQQPYKINLTDIRETRDAPEGNLHYVRKAIEKVAKKLDGSD